MIMEPVWMDGLNTKMDELHKTIGAIRIKTTSCWRN